MSSNPSKDAKTPWPEDSSHPYEECPPPSYEEANSLASPSSSSYPPPPTASTDLQFSERGEPSSSSAPARSSNAYQKPVAIPALTPKLGSPFLRAYAPILEDYQIPAPQFLSLIDELNRAWVTSPPAQLLELAGMVTSFIPLGTAQLAGTIMEGVGKAGGIALSKGMAAQVLSKANRDIFAERGLQCGIMKLEGLAALAGMEGILDSEGKVKKKVDVLDALGAPESRLDGGEMPLADEEEAAVADGRGGERATRVVLSSHARRLAALRPWIAELELTDLPDRQTGSNLMSQWHAAASERMGSRAEAKLQKDRAKMTEKFKKEEAKAREEYEKEMAKIERKERKAEIKGKGKEREDRKMTKLQGKREKTEREFAKEVDKARMDKRKDDKEEAMVRKIPWLVIWKVSEPAVSEPAVPEKRG